MKGGEVVEKLVEKIDFSDKKPLLAWSSPDYISEERGAKWYAYVISVSILLIAFLYWQKIYSGIVLVIVFTVLLIVTSRLKPKIIKSSIYDSGVVIDNKVINYSDIKSFGIIDNFHPKIKLRQNGRFASEISMPAADVDVEEIRHVLLKYLPEEQFSEDLSDIINRIIKF